MLLCLGGSQANDIFAMSDTCYAWDRKNPFSHSTYLPHAFDEQRSSAQRHVVSSDVLFLARSLSGHFWRSRLPLRPPLNYGAAGGVFIGSHWMYIHYARCAWLKKTVCASWLFVAS